jgi:hypothetical protein
MPDGHIAVHTVILFEIYSESQYCHVLEKRITTNIVRNAEGNRKGAKEECSASLRCTKILGISRKAAKYIRRKELFRNRFCICPIPVNLIVNANLGAISSSPLLFVN